MLKRRYSSYFVTLSANTTPPKHCYTFTIYYRRYGLTTNTACLLTIRYDTIRYGIFTCAQMLTRWPA